MTYSWGYTKKTEPRGTILFSALESLLKEGDVFLDMDCGYSPIAKHVLENGYSITGFDISSEVIDYLRRVHPRGRWVTLEDVNAKFQGYSIFLLLGVTTPLYKVYSETYYETTERLLSLNSPRVVLIESADAADQMLYKRVCEMLENTGHYMKKCEEKYDARMEKASRRHYSIWVQQWNYPFWQNLFRNAKDEELDALHERFYREARIKVNPYPVYNSHTKKEIIPTILAKDEFVKKLILEKENVKTILNVGFWRGAFAFHMGLNGFNVDGVECYKKAVDVAKEMQGTLPPQTASRFNFYYGFAEHLEKYPKYDVVVNHCLEHVRDPRHAVKETLEHIKPGGYAYFTPPLRHGCDSPTHLHHFMTEQALLDLLPKGFNANIYSVKFQSSSPIANIFVMEVFKKIGES